MFAAAREFILEFYSKMKESLPWKFMKSLRILDPSQLMTLKIDDCKSVVYLSCNIVYDMYVVYDI